MAEPVANGLQSVESALAALLDGVEALPDEPVAIERAGGRVLSQAVIARQDVPPADNSAMDGYALRCSDAGRTLPITQRVVAGVPPSPLASNSCARIFTGSEIPPGADCVVMQEDVQETAEGIHFPKTLSLGSNIRSRGRDVASGTVLLKAGTRLEAASLGHLAGQGITEVNVRCRPRVALLFTGDEIVDPGKPLAPGQIYNSNRPMLRRLLERFGAEVIMAESVPDRYEATCDKLRQAAGKADIVITTGGVSVGEEDHVKQALEALGTLDLWRLAMRPGKPLALGRLPREDGHGQVRFVGLPGNPVSSYVGAWLFVRPLMGQLLDCPSLQALPRMYARAGFATRTQGRRHYMRVRLDFTPDKITAHAFADQNSAVLSSCIDADALAIVPPFTEVCEGDSLECLWLVEK
ncbi:gephyrin-like molybdotransferase Glp [Modicisalibacter xianhensis]|uniref:Molybdopterin molybdenumtransferase n=1 Tax=Modicisalibacter xianhensis TaxID=442341 RepID=A0A1I3CCA8_9GAMM|nr:gephyrin-like molybdotransferase Glp [Halomonas xianhensis]SFH72195.1 molybdopterin molybdotransferase [Halomonas xianhensis]